MTDQQPGATPPPSATPPTSTSPLLARVQNILLNPVSEWQVIRGEAATIQGLFVGYAAILAAIPALGLFLDALIGGRLISGLLTAIIVYVIGLASAYGLGLLIDMLAPNFGAEKNPVQSMKVAVYGMTAGWLAGIAHALPFVGGLIAALASLYSLYLLFLGIQTVKQAPQDKAIIYTLVTVLIIGVVATIIFMVLSSIFIASVLGATTVVYRF